LSQNPIAVHFQQSLASLERAANDAALLTVTGNIARAIIDALRSGNKVLLAGNGGSAADAQHIAAEIVGRYKKERPGYAAIALTTDTSALTAIANDYGFDQIFARQVEGLGRRGDVLLAYSTSGRSPNILAALRRARECGLVTVGFTGAKGESMGAACDLLFMSPSDDTPVVQQIHMTAGHAICDQVEQAMVERTANT
jgi:D-sedoheptulose 7-phosphate isomerase